MRTDIFAFGALAYEMITGRVAFAGTSQAQLVGAILKDDPPPIADASPRLAQTLSRCLAKDPDDRWQSAGDLLFELRSIAHHGPAAIGAGASRRRTLPRRVERTIWAAAVIACVAAMWFWTRGRDLPPAAAAPGGPPIRYTLSPAVGTTLSSTSGVPFALSPDGRHIVYVAMKADGGEQLWLRSLYSQVEQPLPGTEGGNTPFWSTDSEWIGFFSANTPEEDSRVQRADPSGRRERADKRRRGVERPRRDRVHDRTRRPVAGLRAGRSGVPGDNRQ